MTYSQHPLSAAFPAMSNDDFKALVNDIREHGQRDLATLYDGMVIDGWHRYQACEHLGIPCRFDEFNGQDAVAFVRSKNQHRRHYQKSQQAAIEVSLNNWAESHRPKKGEAASPFSALGRSSIAPATNAEMAKRAGTTERTIQHAKRAHEAGLGEAVRDGKISAELAADIAKADPELAKKVARGEISAKKAAEQVSAKTNSAPGAESQRASNSPEEPDDFDERDLAIESLSSQVDYLKEEIDDLRNQLAAGGNAEYKTRLDELLSENKRLAIMNDALTEARDRVMRENASLKKQCVYSAKKLKALEK